VDLNNDGIWDHPYVIDANNTDRYPLVKPWKLTPPLAEAPWPMYMHDAQRTRQSQYLGPANYSLKWTFAGASGFLVIGQNGTLYAKNTTIIPTYPYYIHKLFAINSNGTLRWSYNVNFYQPPSIGYDGTLYVPSPGGHWLYAIHPDGYKKWAFYTDKSIDCSPAISNDGTIYIGTDDDVLYAINPDGSLKWTFHLNENSSAAKYPSLALDGTIYMSNYPHKFYAINPDGTLKWVIDITAGIGVVGPSATIYLVGSFGQGRMNALYAINPDGTIKWVKDSGYERHLLGVSKDETIYVAEVSASQSKISATDAEGNFRWNYTTQGGIVSTAISSDGTVYFAANYPYGVPYGIISAITSDGSTLWNVNLDDAGLFDVIIGDNRTIYVSGQKGIYAIGLRPTPPAPDFLITASPTSLTIQQGSSDTSVITITSISGFSQPVQLSVSGEPSGVTATLNPVEVTPPPDGTATSTLTVSVDTTATPGSSTLTVTGTNGTITHSTDISLEVTTIPPPPNQPPQPVNIEPPDGATDVSLEPMFLSSPPLSDLTSEQIPWEEMDGIERVTRVYYHVQITTIPGDYSEPVYGFTDYWLIDKFFDFPPSPKRPYVSSGVFDYETTYYWRIRYKDFRDVWSPWSEETSFTTIKSREMQIAWLITQEAIEGVPVTVIGQYYVILTLKSHIDPTTLDVIPDVLTKVYVEATENYPVSDPETARKIGIIDYARQIAEITEEIRDNKEALMKLRDIYLMLSSSDLAIAATNLGVSGVKLIKDMNTISDVLVNIETIKDFAGIAVPRSLAGFFTKTLELVMRKLIYDPMKELESDLRSELSQAIRDYTSALEILETEEITDYSVATSFLSSYLSAKAHEDHAKYLLEKILRNYLVIVDELYKPVAALATWGLSNFVFLVREAMLSLEWTIELLQRQIISTYEKTATLHYKLLASTKYTLELANTPSELIREYNIKYANYMAEGYQLAAEAVEEVLTITIPFIGRISLLSPAELRVYDSNGLVTGVVDGEERNEIPYSVYYENTVVFFSADVYRFEVVGTEEGSYGLEAEGIFLEDNEGITFVAMGIPTTPGAIHQYTVDWAALSLREESVTVQVDSDGDGVFEHTFTSDSELTHDEFMLQTATTIDFDLDTLNLKSKGSVVTVYIEFPEGYDVTDINVSTIMLNRTVPAKLSPTAIGDYDNDTVPDLMVKFDRAELISYILANVNMTQLVEERFMTVTLTITGKLNDGTAFQGSTTITIILPMPRCGRFIQLI